MIYFLQTMAAKSIYRLLLIVFNIIFRSTRYGKNEKSDRVKMSNRYRLIAALLTPWMFTVTTSRAFLFSSNKFSFQSNSLRRKIISQQDETKVFFFFFLKIVNCNYMKIINNFDGKCITNFRANLNLY